MLCQNRLRIFQNQCLVFHFYNVYCNTEVFHHQNNNIVVHVPMGIKYEIKLPKPLTRDVKRTMTCIILYINQKAKTSP